MKGHDSGPAPSVTIVNVGYRSTNFWVVSAGRSRLLVDLGWPGTFSALTANLDRMDVPMREIAYGFATHYHMDHAGAAQDLKNAGMRLIVFDIQLPFVEPMARVMKTSDRYTPISLNDNVVVAVDAGRAILSSLGIEGEFVHTPGHSDDSVSLVLADGSVFMGYLTWPGFATPEDVDAVAASWDLLRSRGAKQVYAGHGPVRRIP